MEEITNKDELFKIADIYELFDWINDQLAPVIIDDIVNETTSDKSNKVVNVNRVSNLCHKYIKESVNSFIKNNDIDAECTEQAYNELCLEFAFSDYGDAIIDTANERINNYFNDKLVDKRIDNANEMNDLKDEVGTTTGIMDGNTIDMCNRDGTFIVINGKLIIGDDDSTHASLINKYIQENLNKEIDEELNYFRVRDTELFDEIDDNIPIAFGHIIGSNAIIETCENCSINDIMPILKENNFDKIYSYNYNANSVTRLAKLELDSLQNIDKIETIEDLYDAVGKDNVFKELNKYIKTYIESDTAAIDILMDRKLEKADNTVKLTGDITVDDWSSFEYFSIIGFIENILMKYKLKGKPMRIARQVRMDYAESPEIKEILDILNKKLHDKYEQYKDKYVADSAYNINDIEDNIGDKTVINDKIDLGSRGGNFIIINGKVISGDDSATHSQLINEYIEKYLNQDTNEDLRMYKVRDTEMFDQIPNDTPIVFGHIVNNIAFIEQCENCTADSAVDDLKNQCNFKKIYEYDAAADAIIRLAKRR